MKKKIFGIISGLIAIMILVVGFISGANNKASATVSADDESLYRLSLMQAVKGCYESSARAEIDTQDTNYQNAAVIPETLLRYIWSGGSQGLNAPAFLKTTAISYHTNNGAVKCDDVVNALKSRYSVPGDLKQLGYRVYVNPADGDAAQFGMNKVELGDDYGGTTPTVSGNVTCYMNASGSNAWVADHCESNLKISTEDMTILELSFANDPIRPTISSSYTDIQNDGFAIREDETSPWVQLYTFFENEKSGGSDYPHSVFEDARFATLIREIIRAHFPDADLTWWVKTVPSGTATSGNVKYTPIKGSAASAGEVAVYNIAGDPAATGWGYILKHPEDSQDAVSYSWNPNDSYALYYSYLTGLESEGYINFSECQSAKPDSGWFFKNSASSWIKIGFRDGVAEQVKGIPVSIIANYGASLGAGTVLDILNTLKEDSFYANVTAYADRPCAGETPTPTPNPTQDDPANYTKIVDCDEFQHIGAMQWVLCPTMNNTQYTANMLDQLTEEMLQIDNDVYTSGNTYKVWEIIRNIANVLLIVFFAIVIFSQLTGYGIDNYGIKKMLPRIIVMAIIINISFYLCQLAIDFSNILGIGLRNMFGGAGNSIGGANGYSFIGMMIMAAFATAPAVTGGASVATTAIFTLGAPVVVGVLLAVIAALIIIIVAIVVLFIMLGVRRIAVILCIILSPLAFTAFILPNTQGVFKKWWDLFKATLIIFPICGAASGISYLLKSMAGDGLALGVAGAVIMMVLPYAVFFLIPTLLKNAISALGKLGGALTAMGQTVRNGGRELGRGARNVIQNTEGYKNLQTEAARRRQNQSAQRTIERLQRIKDNGGTLNERDTRRLARAHETQRRLNAENTAARTILTEREYAGRSQAELVSDWNDAFDSGDAERMDALTNVITSRHGPGGVNAIAKSLAGKDIFDESTGEFVNDEKARSFSALQANMMQNSSFANAMQNKAADVYQMISSGGYVEHDAKDSAGRVQMRPRLDSNGNVMHDASGNVIEEAVRVTGRANLAAHSANNGVATQIKDWATQSSATLERAVTSGSLTQPVAQQILQSSDPSIQSGIASDSAKRQVLEAAAAGYTGDFRNTNAVQQAVNAYNSMEPGYANRSADDVRDEAEMENRARTVGVVGEYRDLSATEAYDRAVRDNERFDRRAESREAIRAQTDEMRRMADSMEQLTSNMNNGPQDSQSQPQNPQNPEPPQAQ